MVNVVVADPNPAAEQNISPHSSISEVAVISSSWLRTASEPWSCEIIPTLSESPHFLATVYICQGNRPDDSSESVVVISNKGALKILATRDVPLVDRTRRSHVVEFLPVSEDTALVLKPKSWAQTNSEVDRWLFTIIRGASLTQLTWNDLPDISGSDSDEADEIGMCSGRVTIDVVAATSELAIGEKGRLQLCPISGVALCLAKMAKSEELILLRFK